MKLFVSFLSLILVVLTPVAVASSEIPSANFYAESEIECMARNIYFESRGESYNGQLAVGHVTLNRSEAGEFPSSICAVVKQGIVKAGKPVRNKCQFSWYCDGRSDIVRDAAAWDQSLSVAHQVLDRAQRFRDVSNGATYYHADYVSPKWAKRFSLVAKIGRHLFYKA